MTGTVVGLRDVDPVDLLVEEVDEVELPGRGVDRDAADADLAGFREGVDVATQDLRRPKAAACRAPRAAGMVPTLIATPETLRVATLSHDETAAPGLIAPAAVRTSVIR